MDMNREMDKNRLVELPQEYETYSEDIKQLVNTYIHSLTETDYKAYLIAKQHLGSSFNILKSNGFMKWKKTIQ